MPHKFDPAHMARLDSPERRKLLPPDEILESFGLSDGEIVVDVGTGVGFFAFEAARMVGSTGHVYALDTSEDMLAELSRRIKDSSRGNVSALRSGDYELPLGAGIADFALLSTVLHEVDEPERFLREIRRVLKPGGRIGVVEWSPNRPNHGHGHPEWLAPEATLSLLGQADFADLSQDELNESAYLTRGVKV